MHAVTNVNNSTVVKWAKTSPLWSDVAKKIIWTSKITGHFLINLPSVYISLAVIMWSVRTVSMTIKGIYFKFVSFPVTLGHFYQ